MKTSTLLRLLISILATEILFASVPHILTDEKSSIVLCHVDVLEPHRVNVRLVHVPWVEVVFPIEPNVAPIFQIGIRVFTNVERGDDASFPSQNFKLHFGQNAWIRFRHVMPFARVVLDVEEAPVLHAAFSSVSRILVGLAIDCGSISVSMYGGIVQLSAHAFESLSRWTTFYSSVLVVFSVSTTWSIPTIPVQSVTLWRFWLDGLVTWIWRHAKTYSYFWWISIGLFEFPMCVRQ